MKFSDNSASGLRDVVESKLLTDVGHNRIVVQ